MGMVIACVLRMRCAWFNVYAIAREKQDKVGMVPWACIKCRDCVAVFVCSLFPLSLSANMSLCSGVKMTSEGAATSEDTIRKTVLCFLGEEASHFCHGFRQEN